MMAFKMRQAIMDKRFISCLPSCDNSLGTIPETTRQCKKRSLSGIWFWNCVFHVFCFFIELNFKSHLEILLGDAVSGDILGKREE